MNEEDMEKTAMPDDPEEAADSVQSDDSDEPDAVEAETAEPEVVATHVAKGDMYAEHGIQRPQSVTSTSHYNDGVGAHAHEHTARTIARPEADGVHVVDGRRVYYKTFRIGIPPGEKLPPDGHTANMRQVNEDVLKAGERVQSPVRLHAVEDDDFGHSVLYSYIVELV